LTMKLIVGLGNPGLFYSNNRHNIGFMCVKYIAKAHSIKLNRKQGQARTGSGDINGQKVTLARPQTFMNNSGEAVSRLLKRLKLTPADLIVIHDDLDLRTGKTRIRFGGSSGGHKGIESIINHIGSRDFYRIKVGIGRPDTPEGTEAEKEAAVIDYVLSGFTRNEKKLIKETIPNVGLAVVCLITEGLEAAMNKYN
jgi:PTH1 family peptidyl-tRNA hydrolase